jgi:hypothetical protein
MQHLTTCPHCHGDHSKILCEQVLQGEETDALVQKHVEAIFAKPEGMMLMMAGIDVGDDFCRSLRLPSLRVICYVCHPL